MKEKKQEILDKLQRIQDPDLKKDIVRLGFVKNIVIQENGNVAFTLELTTPACPVREQFKDECKKAVLELSWVSQVSVTLSSKAREIKRQKNTGGLEKVQHIIAVGSCKGGVGKSTTAVNLAYALSHMGASVGIFDADIYGPSLPTLVDIEFKGLFQREERILPLESHGVKLMSFAYASAHSGGGPAILRGPMVTQIIQQLVMNTDWGKLDYLVLDLPPGTGDIQLTLAQILPITAAVIVTTPQKLSFVDVVKGIKMFDKMRIPTIAIIENMSYFVCTSCNTRHEFFGKGSRKQLTEQFGIQNSFTMPIEEDISRLSDLGKPILLDSPKSSIAAKYLEIADAVVREVSKVVYGDKEDKPNIGYNSEEHTIKVSDRNHSFSWSPKKLRASCRCARCIHEFSGKQLLNPETIDEAIHPTSISPLGNYAISILWSDGHDSIYPYESL